MGNLMNNFYYGKAGKADFTPDQLPANRVQLFFETLRVRFTGLIGMNLLYALICLPAIAWTFINLLVIFNSATDEAAMAAADVARTLSSLPFTYLLFLVPCLMLAGALKPGVVYVLRNWARDQHAFPMSDFKDHVKANWKTGLLTGLVNGLSLLMTYVCYIYYGSMASSTSLFFVVPQVFVLIACVLWWLANMLIFPMMVTYDMKFRQLVRNAFIMITARLPWSVLFGVVSVAIPVVLLAFLPLAYALIGLFVYFLLFGFSLPMFVQCSYANSCFDRFLNPRIEGAPVNQGLRDPSLDDDLDDDEPENADKKD